MMLLILYQFFEIPVLLFFQGEKVLFGETRMNLKAFLWLDILFELNCAVYKRGELYFSRRVIMKCYLKERCLFDLFSLVPAHYSYVLDSNNREGPFVLQSKTNLLKLLFFFKIVQVSKMFTFLQEMVSFDDFYDGLIALAKLTLKIFYVAHLFSCLWNFAGLYEKSFGNPNWKDISQLQDPRKLSWQREYLYAFYWSITTIITVGYGDISPKNDTEVFVSCVAMLVGCGFFAYGINSLGFIMEKFDTKKKILR